MTVRELIEHLQQMPQDIEARVFAELTDMEIKEAEGGDIVLISGEL